MRAILKTLCGCEREMNIPYPPNRVIVLPMRRPISFETCKDGQLPADIKIAMKVRLFDLEYPGGFNETSRYIERWQD